MEADTATGSTPQRDPALVAELNDLIQLDHDAVAGYTVAINALKRDAYRKQLVAFRADHKRHIEELGACVRRRATGHGEGSAHGMAARAVEGINTLIADPMERVGREVMRVWEENRPKR